MEKNTPHDKGEVIQLLLKREGRIMLCLDATNPGVDVPSRFKKDISLMLILNSKMPQPIHIEAKCVYSELRFGGIPHNCTIPFDAIWSIFNPDTNHGMMWPESMPEAVLKQHQMTPFNELKPLPPHPEPTNRPKASAKKSIPFQVIEGGADPKTPPVKSTSKPNLKLVE
ncbi:MAG: hypothetical protein HQL72_13970 [Magnetococcales bacterium]|nr:hypothetical protein [Magnetococcales bacterium]